MVALEIELDEAERLEVGDPQAVVVDDDVERQREAGERFDELDLRRIGRRPEHVDAAAGSIEREDPALGPTAIACTPLNWPGPLPWPPNSPR